MDSRRLYRAVIGSIVASALVLSFLVPSTGADATHASAIKRGGTVTILSSPSGSFTRNFSPFNQSADNYMIRGGLYEPLIMFNTAKGGIAKPWLATKWTWSNGNKVLTLKLRSGVKWSDGKPFTSADVKFSTDLGKKYPAADLAGIWPYLKSVTAPNASTVVFNFKTVNTPLLYYIGEQLRVVPKHIWSTAGDPMQYMNSNPVGTGPFMLGSFTPQVFTYKRNPHYWQTGLPYVDTLRFPAYTSNESGTLALINGEVDWGGLFIPDAQHNYVEQKQGNSYWYFAGGNPVTLYLNNTRAPFNNVHVRRAISLALNRQSLNKVAEYGYEPPMNAGFIQMQYTKRWGNPTVLKSLGSTANLTKARAEMKLAGNVDLSKTFQIGVPNGWTDWNTMVSMLVDQLKAIGIKAEMKLVTFPSEYFHDLQYGSYDMYMGWANGGADPYRIYHDTFWSKIGAPVGQQSLYNYARYHSAKMDSLIVKFSHTASSAQQINLIKQMQVIAAADVPSVPLLHAALWYEYNTTRFTGWPNAANPYNIGPPWQNTSQLDVVLHVHKK